MLSTNEAEFVAEAIQSGLRTDGRGLDEIRGIKIMFGKRWGECEILWGSTRVFAVVTAEVTEPYPDRPTEGMLTFNVELSPMASPAFDPSKTSELTVELTRMLDRCFKESRAVDREALCIVAQEKVWSVRCDVHVLDHDGNLMDASSLGALIALLHFRRRDVSFTGNSTIIHTEAEREPVPLSIHYLPISITFAIFNEGDVLAIDPTELEEAVMKGRLTFTLNSHQDLCSMQKNGGMPIDPDIILQCVNRAIGKVEAITALIQRELERDAAQRLFGRGCISMPPKPAENQPARKKIALPELQSQSTTITVPVSSISAPVTQSIEEYSKFTLPEVTTPAVTTQIQSVKQKQSLPTEPTDENQALSSNNVREDTMVVDTPKQVVNTSTPAMFSGGSSAWDSQEQSDTAATPIDAMSDDVDLTKALKKGKKRKPKS
eukprot:c3549_g1_i1.p1 GENE.c3549_g1_i1~~c3549_g1_i1.p1  ORF type:complete len:433 (-),score=107.95 c3549_g1_i1:60-1358(-)